jgi:MFS family permease
MHQTARILLVTFLEAWSTTIISRGGYFISVWALDFSRAQNLALATVYGVAYIAGALMANRLSGRIGERGLLVWTGAAQILTYAAFCFWLTPAGLFVLFAVSSVASGLRWPVIETYLNAGRTPRQTMPAMGIFNLTWALAAPLSVAAPGFLESALDRWLFLVPGAVSVAVLLLVLPLPARPMHLAADHPERPDHLGLARLKSLTSSSQWLLLASYALAWVLAALVPKIFEDMGFKEFAPALASVLDVARLVTFVAMVLWPGWHGKAWPLLVSVVAMPAGFFMVLFGGALPMMLAGEVVFGLACGLVYYAAFYHAIVMHNASVGAGGQNESLIGMGFVAGPLAGLLGLALAGPLGGEVYGMILGIGPVYLACAAASAWSLRSVLRPRRT